MAVFTAYAPEPARALALCPMAGAAVSIRFEAAAISSPFTVEVSGALLDASCEPPARLAATYTRQFECDPVPSGGCTVELTDLAPGFWSHRIVVTGAASESQQQWQRVLLLDRSAGTHALVWPIFPSVFTVRSLSDQADCSNCLRAALAAAAEVAKPALIQFAPELSGSIVRSPGLPALAASDVTVDAIAPNGVPWQRTLDGNGLDEAALMITGARNVIVGLQFTNTGGNNDVVLIDGGSANDNVLSHVRVAGRAPVTCGKELNGCLVNGVCQIPDVTQPQGVCGDDGVAIRGGAGSGGPNRIEYSDISGAYDKGIKVSDNGVAVIEASYIHDNRDGGIQATLSGTATVLGNLIENNRGTNSANGIAANGPGGGPSMPPSVVTTRGNLVRNNSLRGFSVRSLSLVSLDDDFTCGNGTPGRGTGYGVAISGDSGLAPSVTVRGLASVFNLDGGVNVAGDGQVDFGTASDPGYNAFGSNGDPQVPANFLNLGVPTITAVMNQWEHCGRRPWCDNDAIAAGDVSSMVAFSPALANRWNHDAHIDAVEPSFGAAGDLVRVYGRGFDAIEGQPRGSSCATIAAANRCIPNRGNCVRLGKLTAPVLAVTPTMLIVQLPATCVAPTNLTVRSRHGQQRLRTPFCVLVSQHP